VISKDRMSDYVYRSGLAKEETMSPKKRAMEVVTGLAASAALSGLAGSMAETAPPPYANFEPAQINPVRLSADGARAHCRSR